MKQLKKKNTPSGAFVKPFKDETGKKIFFKFIQVSRF